MQCGKRVNKDLRETLSIYIPFFSDTDNVTDWNKTLTEARVLKKLSDDCAVSYQVRTFFVFVSG